MGSAGRRRISGISGCRGHCAVRFSAEALNDGDEVPPDPDDDDAEEVETKAKLRSKRIRSDPSRDAQVTEAWKRQQGRFKPEPDVFNLLKYCRN